MGVELRPGGPAPRPPPLRPRPAAASSWSSGDALEYLRRERRRFDLDRRGPLRGPVALRPQARLAARRGLPADPQAAPARRLRRLEHHPRDAGRRPGHAPVRRPHRLPRRPRPLEPGHGLRPGPPCAAGAAPTLSPGGRRRPGSFVGSACGACEREDAPGRPLVSPRGAPGAEQDAEAGSSGQGGSERSVSGPPKDVTIPVCGRSTLRTRP